MPVVDRPYSVRQKKEGSSAIALTNDGSAFDRPKLPPKKLPQVKSNDRTPSKVSKTTNSSLPSPPSLSSPVETTSRSLFSDSSDSDSSSVVTLSSKTKLRAGTSTSLSHEKWSDEMRELITDLLAEYAEQPNKLNNVVAEYFRRMAKNVMLNQSTNRLWNTSSRQIAVFERELNKKIERSLAVASLSDDSLHHHQQLKKQISVPSAILTAPPAPSCSNVPQNVDLNQLVTNIPPPVPEVKPEVLLPTAQKITRKETPKIRVEW